MRVRMSLMKSEVRLPGRMPGMNDPVLADVVGNVVRPDDDRNIEVGEEDDAHACRAARTTARPARSASNDAAGRSGCSAPTPPAPNSSGADRMEAGEDDRHHAAGVHLQRQVARLAAHHAAADDAPGALDGNAALAALHEDDEGDHRDHAGDQQNERRNGERAPGVWSGPSRPGRRCRAADRRRCRQRSAGSCRCRCRDR